MPLDTERKRMADSPLARIQPPRPSTAQPRLTPPEHIRLPDGRQVATKDLLGQVHNRQNYNLRNKDPHRPVNRPINKRYTEQDLRWMATAEVADIQAKYAVNSAYAMSLRTRARNQIWYNRGT